jgi:hypothetical protein
MTSKTLKTKQNISLILDKEFIQYCELNEIEDIEGLAKETFKRGFDLLKYGSIPNGEISSQSKEKAVSESPKRVIPSVPPENREKVNEGVDKPEPKIVEATPLKASDGKDAFTEMGVKPKLRSAKKELYDE